jgi:hypothetical protein
VPAFVLVVVPLGLAVVAWLILRRRPQEAAATTEPEPVEAPEPPPSAVLAETAEHAR